MREITEEIFLRDVVNHEMTVLKDDGIYRHLRFASKGPHSWSQWFQIVTWPGFLAYSGDMGCFVFSRIEDMFQFFRTRPSSDTAKLHINRGYWAEKLEAVDRDGRSNSERQYSPDLFRAEVKGHVKEWIEENALHDADLEQLRSSIEDEVLRYADDSEHEARQALDDFSFESEGGDELKFTDTWEWDFHEYTGRFVWCCYAIAWAIQQYDTATSSSDPVEEHAA